MSEVRSKPPFFSENESLCERLFELWFEGVQSMRRKKEGKGKNEKN